MKKAADYDEPAAFWREIIADQQWLLALAKQLGRDLRHLSVLLPVIMFRPGIEMEMDNGGVRLEFRLQAASRPAKARTPNLPSHKIGPLSRIQPRLVGCKINSTFFKSQPARFK